MKKQNISSTEVKDMAQALGADLCGIAGVDRFSEAPEGFHPLDVFPECKSVISFAVRFPVGTLACKTPIPYTRVRNSITPRLDALALSLCIELEKRGVTAVPIPTNEAIWDEKTQRHRSILSQKHAAQAAGLGTIGRHSMLITPEFGSMVWLGCVLCDAQLEADALKESICTDCDKCVKVCPINALENIDLNQNACWDYAFGNDENMKAWVISCHKCRDICPFNLGTENGKLMQ